MFMKYCAISFPTIICNHLIIEYCKKATISTSQIPCKFPVKLFDIIEFRGTYFIYKFSLQDICLYIIQNLNICIIHSAVLWHMNWTYIQFLPIPTAIVKSVTSYYKCLTVSLTYWLWISHHPSSFCTTCVTWICLNSAATTTQRWRSF